MFFGIAGELVTPSQEASNLQGLTKQTVHQVCRRAGLACDERAVDVDLLTQADECFLTSATREVMAVSSILLENGETKTFPAGGGALTHQVAALYKDFVHEHVDKNRHRALF